LNQLKDLLLEGLRRGFEALGGVVFVESQQQMKEGLRGHKYPSPKN
jgi:hypothetical protein